MLRDIGNRISNSDIVLDVGANIGNNVIYVAVALHCTVDALQLDEELARAPTKAEHMIKSKPYAIEGQGDWVNL